MGFLKRLRSLGRDEGGNTLALGAVALPFMIGGAGLAIDTVQISLAKRELQRAADSAAMAGVYAINQNPSSTGTTRTTLARNGATRDLQINNDVPLSTPAVIENAPTAGTRSGDSNAVRVQLTANRTLSFFSFFDATPTTLRVEATAAIVREGSFCMLSLEDTAVAGVTIGGNATINIGCGISTNSRAASAITATGSSSVIASPIMAVGGVPAGNFNNSTLIPYAPVQDDPFAHIPTPTPANCVAPPDSQPNKDVPITTSTPGYTSATRSFCFSGGWDVKGNVTLDFAEPTIVYIDGGTLSFGSQAHVVARNVTFILTSTNATSDPSSIATLNMNGGADLDINAPTTGLYADIAFYEDRRAPLGRTITYNGNSGSTINGAMYFPRSKFSYLGTAQTSATCIQLVARRLDFSGNGTIRNSCSSTTPGENFQATYVRLVA